MSWNETARLTARIALFVVMLALVPGSSLAGDEATTVREGEHFRITCHFENATMADLALEAAEGAWDRTTPRVRGRKAKPLKELIDLHVYRNREDYMFGLKKLADRHQLPSAEAIFTTDLGKLRESDRYATWWLFYRFLSTQTHAARLRKLLAKVRSQGGGSTYGKRLFEHAEKTWGKKGMTSLDTGFRKYVASRKPVWDQAIRTMGIQGTTWTQMAYDTSNAICWQTRSVGSSTYTLSGSVEVLPAKATQMECPARAQ